MSDTPWIRGDEKFTTIAIAYDLRQYLYALLESSDHDELKNACNRLRGSQNDVLIDKLAALETAIKREIGVYEIPLYPTIQGFKRVSFGKAKAAAIRRSRRHT